MPLSEVYEKGLIDRLPPVRGRLTMDAPLDKVTWFRVGGPAEVLFKPEDADDLAEFIRNKSDDVAFTMLGVGSNLLVRDGGIKGVVVRLGRKFAEIKVKGDEITVGAAALDLNVAKIAAENSISGLEFLSGIPGTIGGALRMNAGAYGREMKDVLIECVAIRPDGQKVTLSLDDMGYSYRHCGLGEDWIFTQATLKGEPGDPEKIHAEMDRIHTERNQSQPVRSRTGGSTFANPEGHSAWKLIDEAGCRGLKIGGAQVSEQHCNFLINTGDATAEDLENLGDEVKRRVFDNSGVELRWEIKRIGQKKGENA